jgi:hypothetical protein
MMPKAIACRSLPDVVIIEVAPVLLPSGAEHRFLHCLGRNNARAPAVLGYSASSRLRSIICSASKIIVSLSRTLSGIAFRSCK